MLNPINKTIELADGRTITIETGKLAKQADGAVTVRMGNTVLLATVCAAKDANPGVDFMPQLLPHWPYRIFLSTDRSPNVVSHVSMASMLLTPRSLNWKKQILILWWAQRLTTS